MLSSGTIPFDPAALRERRIGAGLLQSALAERAGLTQRYISDLERGNHKPTAPRLRALADALACTVADLQGAR